MPFVRVFPAAPMAAPVREQSGSHRRGTAEPLTAASTRTGSGDSGGRVTVLSWERLVKR